MTDSDRLAEIEAACVLKAFPETRAIANKGWLWSALEQTCAIARGFEAERDKVQRSYELATERAERAEATNRYHHDIAVRDSFARQKAEKERDAARLEYKRLSECHEAAVRQLTGDVKKARAEADALKVQLKSTAESWQEETTRLSKERDLNIAAYEREMRVSEERAREADALRAALEVGVNGLGCAALDLDWGAEQMRKAGLKHHKRLSRAAEYARENEAALASGTAKAVSGAEATSRASLSPERHQPAAATPAKACPECERGAHQKCSVEPDQDRRCCCKPAPPPPCCGANADDDSGPHDTYCKNYKAPPPEACPGAAGRIRIDGHYMTGLTITPEVGHCPACPSRGRG